MSTLQRPDNAVEAAATESAVAGESATGVAPARRPLLHPLARILIAVVAFFAVMFVVQALGTPILQLALTDEASVIGLVVTMIVQVVLGAAVVAGLCLLMRLIDRRPVREMGLRWTRGSAAALLLGTAIAAVVVVAAQGIAMATGTIAPADLTAFATSSPLIIALALFQAAVVKGFVLQAIPGEFTYRGYFLQTWRERPALVIAISTVVFGAVHIISNGGQQNFAERLLYLWPAAAFGFVAALLLLHTRSTWAAVGIHGGFHVGAVLAGLIGDTSGVAVWIAQGALFTLVGVVLCVWAQRKGLFRRPIVIDR